MVPNFDQIIRGYPWYEIVFELALIWLGVYLALRFLKGTRGAGVIKGFMLILVLLTLTIRVIGESIDAFGRLNFIYDKFLGLVAILLIVVFQPELRQAMIRLGHARLMRRRGRQLTHVIDAVADAVQFLSKSKFGALIAIERNVGLRGLTEGGVRLNADVSAQLLESIFWPNSPLHDLGVVIHGDRVIAGCVQFPLAEQGLAGPDLGSRHRAALGLTLESDCLVVIVSEETGGISIAEHGQLARNIARDDIHEQLARRMSSPATPPQTSEQIDGALADAPSAPPATTGGKVPGAASGADTAAA